MHIIIGILATIIIFAILVVVHEGGHFFAAKAVGVKVNEFSLGMGPLLLKKQKGETLYSVRAFPIGGFVSMEGEDNDSDDERAFNKKPWWAKFIVIVAGPLMNFVLAVFVLAGIIIYMGTSISPVINEIQPDSPAQAAGLSVGDKIIAINDVDTADGSDISEAIAAAAKDDDSVKITYLEKGVKNAEKTSTVEFKENSDGKKLIGVTFKVNHNLFSGLILGVKNSVNMEKMMLSALADLVTGKGSVDDVVGPVGLVNVVEETTQTGILNLIYLLALLSLNLALVNILPFPALDGGRLLFIIIRLFTGKAISDETEGKIHFVGIMILFFLMILITFKDINTFIFHA